MSGGDGKHFAPSHTTDNLAFQWSQAQKLKFVCDRFEFKLPRWERFRQSLDARLLARQQDWGLYTTYHHLL